MDNSTQSHAGGFQSLWLNLRGKPLDITSSQLLSYGFLIVAAYPVLVSFLRFRRLKSLHKKYNYPTRASLSRMTDDEAWEIQKAMLELEFPFIFVKALQFALFRVRTGPYHIWLLNVCRYLVLMAPQDLWHTHYLQTPHHYQPIL